MIGSVIHFLQNIYKKSEIQSGNVNDLHRVKFFRGLDIIL